MAQDQDIGDLVTDLLDQVHSLEDSQDSLIALVEGYCDIIDKNAANEEKLREAIGKIRAQAVEAAKAVKENTRDDGTKPGPFNPSANDFDPSANDAKG